MGKQILSSLMTAAALLFAVADAWAADPQATYETSGDTLTLAPKAAENPDGVPSPTEQIQRPNRPTVGLVLSGGGAKGIAHVGVIKALEEHDIPIDYVTGTSMGAIVGSLYSCGWSPEKMMELFTSKDFGYWSTGTINPRYISYYAKPSQTPAWATVNLALKDSADRAPLGMAMQVLPSNLISPIPMNIEFLRLFSPYTLQCKENFNQLFVPFRCVTSDVYHKHKIVCSEGSLGDAVRASMSFPLVFKPIKMDGVLVYDGGIYDNFPVDVMEKDFNPDFIIGVSVSSPDAPPQQNDIYSQLEDMIIQNNNYSVPAKKGIKIQVPVLEFGVLDFGEAQEIYEIGYQTGMAMVDSIQKRVKSRVPMEDVTRRREQFAAATPEVRFDSIAVTGASRMQSNFLTKLFNPDKEKSINLTQVTEGYYRAINTGKLSDLLPQAEFGRRSRHSALGTDNKLLLEASLKNRWSFGIGGWITSSTNSQLYLSFGYRTLSFNSLSMDLSGWIGQSYYAGRLGGKFELAGETPSDVSLEFVASRQKYYDSELLFYENSTPSFISDTQVFARATYTRQAGMEAKTYGSFGWGYLGDSYFPTNIADFSKLSKDKTRYSAGELRLGIEGNTLNDEMYPNHGRYWKAEALGTYEYTSYLPEGDKNREKKYGAHPTLSLQLLWKQYFDVSRRVSIGLYAQAYGTLEKLYQDYTATLVHSTPFAPTPSTRNYFNVAFRSDSFLAVGVSPVWNPFGNFQLRGDFFGYSPFRNIRENAQGMAEYNGSFHKAEFIGEVAAVYNFSFASLSVYVNYLSYPSRNWNFGLNLGLFFQAPKFLRN